MNASRMMNALLRKSVQRKSIQAWSFCNLSLLSLPEKQSSLPYFLRVGTLFIVLLMAIPGKAQTSATASTSPVLLSADQMHTFEDALAAIASRAHVTFIAEDAPLHPDLPKEVAGQIISATSLDQQILRIANSCDYNISKTDNIYGFVKRYTNPHDIPSLTMEEINVASSRYFDVMNKFWPYKSWNDNFYRGSSILKESRQLNNCLSDEQLKESVVGDLKYTSLNSATKKTILDLEACRQLYQTMSLLVQIRPWLNQSSDSVVLKWEFPQEFQFHMPLFDRSTPPSQLFFGFHALSTIVDDPKFFIPLTGRYATNSSFFNGSIQLRGHIVGRPDPPSPPDPTSPENDLPVHNLQACRTLRDTVALLNSGKSNAPVLSIDPGLKSKFVTGIGLDNAALPGVAQMIARIYGLSIVLSSESGRSIYRLTYPPFKTPVSFADIQPALLSALPAPLYRALHLEDLPSDQIYGLSAREHTNPDEDESIDELNYAMEKRRMKNGPNISAVSITVPGQLHVAAIAHLRRLVEPHLKQEADAEISWASLDDEERDAFATVLFTSVLADTAISSLYHPTEPFKYLEDMTIEGVQQKAYDGKLHIDLFLCLKDQGGDVLFRSPIGTATLQSDSSVGGESKSPP